MTAVQSANESALDDREPTALDDPEAHDGIHTTEPTTPDYRPWPVANGTRPAIPASTAREPRVRAERMPAIGTTWETNEASIGFARLERTRKRAYSPMMPPVEAAFLQPAAAHDSAAMLHDRAAELFDALGKSALRHEWTCSHPG